MVSCKSLSLLLLTASFTTAQNNPGAGAPDSNTDSFKSEMLRVHNLYRKEHGAEPLVWSTDLAAFAKKHSSTCVFKHSDQGSRKSGENIAWGYPTAFAAGKAWGDERDGYRYGSGEYNHFTQMVWKGTKQIGCGVVQCPKLPHYITCEYFPAGNMQGQFPQNVSPKKPSSGRRSRAVGGGSVTRV